MLWSNGVSTLLNLINDVAIDDLSNNCESETDDCVEAEKTWEMSKLLILYADEEEEVICALEKVRKGRRSPQKS